MEKVFKQTAKNKLSMVLTYVFYPTGIYHIWTKDNRLSIQLLYTIIGLPVSLLIFTYLLIIIFAAFLPTLDLSMGHRHDRELYNSAGNYSVNFLKTGRETGGAYELVRVELEPKGGNDWHYHKTFEEEFTVEEGEMVIGLDGKEHHLKKGETIIAKRTNMHFFKNPTSSKAVLLVKASPARGLEKTIRVGYGLANDGHIGESGFSKNPWHMALLMGYSESYLMGLPSFIQEPLVKSLAKIAQWKGEDKVLKKYFM
jgi:quercetin dioxygenase-like cupin family protein